MTWQELLNEGEKRLSKKGVPGGKIKCMVFIFWIVLKRQRAVSF